MAGNDSYTKLLLHMDDVGLTDSSPSGHTITKNGDVTRSAIQSKFGGYSGYFDGASDYLSIPDSNDWDFGDGDFTIDFWLYAKDYYSELSSWPTLFGQFNSTQYCPITAYIHPTEEKVVIYGTTQTGAWDFVAGDGFALSLDTWTHIALIRSGNNFYTAKNGTIEATSNVTGDSLMNLNRTFAVGCKVYDGGIQQYLNGHIDEFRVSKDIARWTSNFTPPTKAYNEYNNSITGSVSASSRILTVEEATWTIIGNETVPAGSYEIETTSGTQLIIARRETDGRVLAYGSVTPKT